MDFVLEVPGKLEHIIIPNMQSRIPIVFFTVILSLSIKNDKIMVITEFVENKMAINVGEALSRTAYDKKVIEKHTRQTPSRKSLKKSYILSFNLAFFILLIASGSKRSPPIKNRMKFRTSGCTSPAINFVTGSNVAKSRAVIIIYGRPFFKEESSKILFFLCEYK